MKHFFTLLIAVAVLFNFAAAQNKTQLDLNGDIIPQAALIAQSLNHGSPATVPGMADMRSEWMAKGPWGGNIRGLATNTVDGMNVVVACGHSQASNGGMWYSNNGGETWNASNIGNKVMYGVTALPGEDGVFYAGGKNGIYESIDGGATWNLIAFPSTTIIDLGIQEANMDIMIAGIASNQGLKYTDDGGANWYATNLVQGFMKDFACSPADPDLMFVAISGSNGSGLYTSTTGADWTAINPAGSGQCYGVYVDPADANFVLLGAENGIFKSTDGGQNWIQVQSTGNFARGIVNYEGNFYTVVYNGPIYQSADNGDTWTIVEENIVERTWSSVGVSDAGVLFGNWGSIVRGDVDGFELSVQGLNNVYVHAIAYYADRNELWAGSEGSGIWLSTDNGETWTNKSNGLQGWWAYTFAPANHEDWSVGRMMVSTNNGVFYSDDYGDNWQVLDQSTTYYTGAMIHWNDPDIMWVAGATGPVQFTTDGGENWTASAGLPFAFYPRFGLCENESDDPRVMIIYEQLGTNSYYSDDMGANYSECSGLSGTSYFTDLSVRLGDGNLGQKVYMSTDQGIFKSDNGVEYTLCPQLNGLAWSVLGSQGTDVYAGASNGVFHSADEGETWEAFNTGIDYIAIWDLKYGSSTDVIYAGTRGYSVYKYGEDAPPTYTLPFSEDFTGQQQPANWQNVDNIGGDLVWQFNNPGGRDITGAGFDADFAILDSDEYGSGAAQDADLITPPIDCSSASSVMLTFDQSFREYSGSVGTLSVSNNGSDWTEIYTVEESIGYPNPAVSMEFDISEVAAGQPQVWVKWNYVGDWAYWWAIDNVQIFEGTPVYSLPFAEDFTGQQLPEDWQNIDNLGDTLNWQFNNPGGRDITGAGFDADFAILDSDEYGSGSAQDADLITPAIDCSDVESVTLSFDQSFREYSGSVGTLSVSNNGTDWTTIYTVEESTGYPNPAVTVQFDISAVAAGQATVWIKWNYVGDWAYWWAIDNVSVIEGPLTYSLPFTEDFSGQMLPEDWQNIDNIGDTLYWQFDNPGGRDITGAGFDADFAILDSDEYGSGAAQDADLISPPINCSNVDYVNLAFDQSFREYGESVGTVLISTNETDWTAVYTVEESTGYPNPAMTVELDISQYAAGEPTVWIKWNYVGDYAYWWAIDNVSVTEGSAPVLVPPANLEASVELNNVTLTWDAPGTEALEGYNVYRDNTLVTLSPITETTYVDEFVVAGTHLYKVTAVYTEGESTPAGPVQVTIEGNVGKIHGFVRDAVTLLTLDEATVTASDVDNGAITTMTPFGAYYSMLLQEGTYTLTCTAEGYEPATAENLLVMEGVNKSYTFYLQPLTETLTGIGEDNGTAYSFYPNPASDQLTVTGTNIRELAIFNQSGQLMMTVKDIRGKQTLNIGSLPAGIYFVKMTTAESVSMDKLIIR